MNGWPYLVVLVLLAGMLLLSMRNRRRAAAQEAERSSQIAPGTEVMTTSGLYGVVVSKNPDDGTVLLSIAPGVEVKWALAALRDAASLPNQYRRGIYDAPDGPVAEQLDEGPDGPQPGQ